MNHHPSPTWLAAYHDGELNERQAHLLEAHLQTCAQCQRARAELQSLTALLAEVPLPDPQTAPETFVTQVGLRMPRRPVQSEWQRALRAAWHWAPAGLLGAWAFLQAAFFVTSLVLILVAYLPGAEALARWLPQGSSFFGQAASLGSASPLEIGSFGLEVLRGGGILGWGLTLDLLLSALLGLIALSWLASWWIQKSNGQFNPIEEHRYFQRSS